MYLAKGSKSGLDNRQTMMQVPGFKLDNINLFKLLTYMERSRLSQKLMGFVNHTAARQAETRVEKKNVSLLSTTMEGFPSTYLPC